MKKSKERWSEADFASNVYTLLRSTAMRESSYRYVRLCGYHNKQRSLNPLFSEINAVSNYHSISLPASPSLYPRAALSPPKPLSQMAPCSSDLPRCKRPHSPGAQHTSVSMSILLQSAPVAMTAKALSAIRPRLPHGHRRHRCLSARVYSSRTRNRAAIH